MSSSFRKTKTIAIKKGRTNLGVTECSEMLNPKTCNLLGQINLQFDETNQRLADITAILKKLECVDRGLRRKEMGLQTQIDKLQAKLKQKMDRIQALREQGKSVAAATKELKKDQRELQKMRNQQKGVAEKIAQNDVKFKTMQAELNNYKKLEATFADISTNLGLLDNRSQKIYETLTKTSQTGAGERAIRTTGTKAPQNTVPLQEQRGPRRAPIKRETDLPFAPEEGESDYEDHDNYPGEIEYDNELPQWPPTGTIPLDTDAMDIDQVIEEVPGGQQESNPATRQTMPSEPRSRTTRRSEPRSVPLIMVDPVMEQRAAQVLAQSRVLTGQAINYARETKVRLNEIKKVLKQDAKQLQELYKSAPLSDATLANIKKQLASIDRKVKNITETIANRDAPRRSARIV